MTTDTKSVLNDPVAVFEAPPDRRRFSPGDVSRLLVGAFLVFVGAILAELATATITGIEEDLIRALARIPGEIERTVLALTQLVTYLVPFIVLLVLLVRRRWRIAGLLVLASVGSSLALAFADSLVLDRGLGEILETFAAEDGALTDPSFPGANVIASTTAMVIVAVPWLSLRWKRALWAVVALLVLLRLVAVAHPALDLVMAIGIGTVFGSLILLVFGSPSSEPQPSELVDALRSAGIEPDSIERASSRDGALGYGVVDSDGNRLVVKLRTPDERDAERLRRLPRRLRYRASEVGIPYGTVKRRVEHEALVLALADRAGARVVPALRIGETRRGSVFYAAPKLPTRSATSEDVQTPGILEDLWLQVAHLHGAGIAHRHLALESFEVDDEGKIWLSGFDAAEIAPTSRDRARDVAQLLAETGAIVGAEGAVAAAVEVMGPQRVGPALRMLQPLALPRATRTRMKNSPGLLEQLRAAVGEATGEPELELDDLERIKPRTMLIIGASSLAFYSLLPQLANLDDTVDAFTEARPVWLVGAVIASVLTYVFAAVSFQGAVPEPTPFASTLRAQVASSFAGLVGPAGAGGFALTERFLERFGVQRAEATASVAVNAIAGFAVHFALLFGFIVWTGNSSIGGFSLPDSHTVLLVLAGVLALVGVLAAVGPVRRKIFAPLWAAVRTGASSIGRVFTNPIRVIQLFGGSLGISFAYLATLACTVEAFGGGISLPQIGAAYLGAAAIATLAPTPGGLGALESAMIAALTGFGLGAGIAVSATLTFRLATFWLPILPGWLALNHMQQNDEV